MAEETKATTETTEVKGTEAEKGTQTPTVEELIQQLSEEKARADKNKLELDKALKENGTVKKALRAKQTAEEQEAEAKAEAEKARQEELETLRKELNHNKAVNAYRSISDDKMVESLIDAVSDADHNAIAKIMEKYATTKVKEAQAEWLKSRPPVNMGGNGALTKEQFENMSLQEKSKLYRENKAEYDRLRN